MASPFARRAAWTSLTACLMATTTAWAEPVANCPPGLYRPFYPSTNEVCPAPTPGMPRELIPTPQSGQASETPSAALPTLSPALASGVAGTEQVPLSVGAYVDSAVPRSQFRLRFDAAYDDNRPDRAEFFYPKCGCFPNGRGPAMAEPRVDYQEFASYLEYALNPQFSVFIEAPYRSINPQVNPNEDLFGDINAGFKWAFLYCPERVGTFQLRTYIPTGLGKFGLGTDHVSLEPALLFYQKLSDRLTFEAELRDWIPIGGTDFAGNVLRYGASLGYEFYHTDRFRTWAVGEMVGWTALSGKEFDAIENQTFDSAGHTIVNAKAGLRFGFGDVAEPGLLSRSDLFVGYARALTGDFWYKEALRVEFRFRF